MQHITHIRLLCLFNVGISIMYTENTWASKHIHLYSHSVGIGGPRWWLTPAVFYPELHGLPPPNITCNNMYMPLSPFTSVGRYILLQYTPGIVVRGDCVECVSVH